MMIMWATQWQTITKITIGGAIPSHGTGRFKEVGCASWWSTCKHRSSVPMQAWVPHLKPSSHLQRDLFNWISTWKTTKVAISPFFQPKWKIKWARIIFESPWGFYEDVMSATFLEQLERCVKLWRHVETCGDHVCLSPFQATSWIHRLIRYFSLQYLILALTISLRWGQTKGSCMDEY